MFYNVYGSVFNTVNNKKNQILKATKSILYNLLTMFVLVPPFVFQQNAYWPRRSHEQ